jgi:subtilisin family serine protease
MKFRSLPVAVASLLALAACTDTTVPTALAPAAPLRSTSATPTSVGGKYLVNFESNGVPADFAARVAALGARVDASFPGVGIAVVTGLSDLAASTLAATPGVTTVDADHEFQLLEPATTTVADASAAGVAATASPASAFFFRRQWDMRAIGADKAWAAGKLGSAGVRVAILDTGIDYTNPDLVGRVDLSRSKSFVTVDDPYLAFYFPKKNKVTDLHFHGTHVAATVVSNGGTTAGVTQNTTLMAVKVLSVFGSGTTSGVLGGIMYAADNGADVINMSLGSVASTSEPGIKEFLKTVNKAVMYAVLKGVTVVVAAGNAGTNLDTNKGEIALYCDHPAVICVSATGPTAAAGVNGPWTNVDALAPYSNYGISAVDVAAPGGAAGGPVWSACSQTSLQAPICQTGIFTLGISGTSMASPHVAGLAALLVAKYGHKNPLAVRLGIQATADDLGAPGYDAQYGTGRINVARALGIRTIALR